MGTTQNRPPSFASHEQIQELLDALDAASCPISKDVRRTRRLHYRTLDVTIDVLNHRGESALRLTVPTRNISAGGLAFLHRQMLTVGATMRVQIPRIDQPALQVLARVTRCRHVRGMVHEVGVAFMPPESN